MHEMHRWPEYPDEKVFGGAGEQPGSQGAYWREIEIKRRHYLLEKATSEATIAAAKAQSEAAEWTKRSAIAVFFTAIIAGLALLFQIASAIS